MDVAIILDLREPEVTQLYKESLNLMQLRELNRIYLETEGNVGLFLKLYRMAKAGYTEEQLAWFVKVANQGLPELEQRYNNLKTEYDWLEIKKQNQLKLIQIYEDQKTALGKSLDDYFLRCEEEGRKLAYLRSRRMNEEARHKDLSIHIANEIFDNYTYDKSPQPSLPLFLSHKE